MEGEIEIKVSLKRESDINYDIIKEFKLDSKFVSEGIGEDYKQWNAYNPVFISAQTGMGKNTFIEEVLIKYATELREKVLIISNRIANSRQQKERIAMLVRCEEELEKYTSKGLDALEDFNNVKIMTYHKLGSEYDDLLIANQYRQYRIVIFDECHFFMSDALFNNKTGRIFKKSLSIFKNSVRVYMTATDEEVLPVIIKKEEFLQKETFENLLSTTIRGICIKPKEVLYYNFKRNYDYINAKYFDSKDEILEAIKNDKSEYKWLIFVNSKDDGKKIVSEIGNGATFITAESKDSRGLDGKAYEEIVKEEKFSCKVLVTTSALDNGVNFKDDLLKNIVICTHDKTEFIQMLGRKRIIGDEQINLYICARNVAYFNNRLRTVKSKIEAILLYKKNLKLFINNYLLNNWNYNHEGITQLFYVDDKADIHLNDIAQAKLFHDKTFLEKMKNELECGKKEVFILEQLSWLGLQNTYGDEHWLSHTYADENQGEFLELLDSNCGVKLSKEQFNIFAKQFKEHVIRIYGKQEGDRSDRDYGETKIRKIFDKYGLSYEIDIKDSMYTLRKINKK